MVLAIAASGMFAIAATGDSERTLFAAAASEQVDQLEFQCGPTEIPPNR